MSRLLLKDDVITFIKGLQPVPEALLQQIEKDYDSTVKELWTILKEEWKRLCKYRGVRFLDYLYPILDALFLIPAINLSFNCRQHDRWSCSNV
jgi:hypothetical protein